VHYPIQIDSFFKQNKVQGKTLTPDKCNKIDNTSFFRFVRAWWFDNRKSQSELGSAPKFLRVKGDNICLCNTCKEGFENDDYEDKTCVCWKVHNMVFKCSRDYKVCSYQQFLSTLSK
jgi:hypothetical protein